MEKRYCYVRYKRYWIVGEIISTKRYYDVDNDPNDYYLVKLPNGKLKEFCNVYEIKNEGKN